MPSLYLTACTAGAKTKKESEAKELEEHVPWLSIEATSCFNLRHIWDCLMFILHVQGPAKISEVVRRH